MKSRIALVSACLFFPAVGLAQTGYSITGGLSNFDCGNHCDDSCDEFEIEIEDCRPEDIIHTYRNGNYGSPVVMLSSSGTFTIIDYRNPQHLTAVNAIEHFGVALRQLGPTNTIRVKWMRNGHPQTVNGHIPFDGGTAANTQPLMPTIVAEMDPYYSVTGAFILTVTNNDPSQCIWVKRSGMLTTSSVSLEALMTNDPLITSTYPIDNVPFLLGPAQSATLTTDLLEIEENQTAVFNAQYHQDLFVGGPFGSSHVLGPMLGHVMTASLASPDAGCGQSYPFIVTQPLSANADEGRDVSVRINADANDGGTLLYQWYKDGVELTNGGAYHAVTTDEVTIDPLTAASEGFYTCRMTNSCGSIVSDSALVFITGHNIIRAPLNITADPGDISLFQGDSLAISATGALVPAGTTYQWKRGTTAVTEGDAGASVGGGFVTGSSGNGDSLPITFTIDNFQPSDAGDYTVTFTNAAGSATSNIVHVALDIPFCAADFNQDATVDFFDYLDFVDAFSLMDPVADFNGDGTLDFFDYLDFVDAFSIGC